MTPSAEHAALLLAAIGLLGLGCQWLAWWVKLPAILFLLLGGVALGPLSGILQPDALFGDLLLPVVSLSVAVILFEGSLGLRFEQIRGLETVVRHMISTGLLVTWSVTALASHWLLAFPWSLALLFGALTVVTGPTVIVPMLRSVRPTARIAHILRWEGIVIDPIGALLAVLVFEFIVSGQSSAALGHSLWVFARILLAGGLLGAAAGQLLGVVLRRYWLPHYLHNLATLTLVFAVFALANVVQQESGLLAVTVMGIWLGNMRRVPLEDILDFKESLSLLLISGLFILLAARLRLADVLTLGWGAVGVLLVMQFVARPLKVVVASWGSALSWRERALLAWIAPRGIVAAAVSALFALRLEEQGQAMAGLLVPLTFLVIIGTVVLQSATARALARALGVREPDPHGFLIIGANPLARTIAKALDEHGFQTLLVDNNRAYVRAAAMHGLKVFYGSAVSEQADRQLDLVGLGSLLGLAPQAEANALAAMRYRAEFGDGAVFSLAAESANGKPAEAQVGRTLFGLEVSYGRLADILRDGGRIRATGLTEAFDFDAYYRKHYTRAVPLFAMTPKGSLRVFTAEDPPKPEPGWTILALSEADEPPLPNP